MKSVNLKSKDILDLNLSSFFNSSMLVSGVARIGKTTFLLYGLEEKIKENKNIIFITKRKEETEKILLLAKKYNRETDIVIYDNNSFSFSNNQITIVEYNQFQMLNSNFFILEHLITLYSDLKNHELFLFIDEIEPLLLEPSFNKLISVALKLGLTTFISSNGILYNDFLYSNINKHIYFKINDSEGREYLSSLFNIPVSFFLFFNKGEFLYKENNNDFLCSF